jgi:hypothetical protein
MKQKDNQRTEEYYKRVLHLANQLQIKATNIFEMMWDTLIERYCEL